MRFVAITTLAVDGQTTKTWRCNTMNRLPNITVKRGAPKHALTSNVVPPNRITEHIRDWLARRQLHRYKLRPATECDLDFIMTEVIDGAKHGYYAFSLLDPMQAQGFRDQLWNTIHFLAMERETDDRRAERIKAQLYIYGSKNDDPVGYLLVAEKAPGSLAHEVELYQVGVRKDRRRQGHGRRVVQLFIALIPPSVKLYARCSSPSQAMFLLLQEIGFSHFNTMPRGTRELELCKT